MTKTSPLLFACLLLVIGGCFLVQPELTPEELLVAQTRDYKDISAKRVLQAATEVFHLADGPDFSFGREPSILHANRIVDLMNKNEYWTVEAQESQGITRVRLSVVLNVGQFTLQPSDVGVYELFYTRLDNRLGLSNNWVTCEEFEDEIEKHPVWEDDGFLCQFADDNVPQGL